MASGRLILPVTEPVLEGSPSLPISGATLAVYIAGSPTLANLFTNAALSTPANNPQTSNAAGLFYTQGTVLWADAAQAYDCVVTWPDATSDTFQNIYLVGAASNVAGFAPINSPTFTGNPQAPTTALNDNSASLATTAYVQGQNYAPLASPALTGVPTAPTATAITNNTQIATTFYVTRALSIGFPVSSTNGHFKIAGFLFQWAQFSLGASGGASQTVNWPVAFPNAVIGTPWIGVDTGALQMIGCTSAGLNTVTVNKGIGDTFARTGTVYGMGY